MLDYLVEASSGAIDLIAVRKADFTGWLAAQPGHVAAWTQANGFTGETGQVCPVPGIDGGLSFVLVGQAEEFDPWAFAALPAKLPAGTYRATALADRRAADWAALGWALATYCFDRYKSRADRVWPHLVWPDSADRGWYILR